MSMFEQGLNLNLLTFRTFTVVACLLLVAGCGGEDEQASAGVLGVQTTAAATASSSSSSSSSSSAQSQAPAAQTPAAPTGLIATPGSAQVALSWSASSNATSYAVKRAATSGGPYANLGTATVTSYLDSTAVNGTTYFYVVAAVNSAGSSANSAQVSATPTTSAPTGTVPSAPSALTATPWDAQITLTWSASAGASSYTIKRSSSSGGQYVDIATATTAYYADAGLATVQPIIMLSLR